MKPLFLVVERFGEGFAGGAEELGGTVVVEALVGCAFGDFLFFGRAVFFSFAALELVIPEFFREHGEDVALELGHRFGGGGLGVAECLIDRFVTLVHRRCRRGHSRRARR